MSFEGSSTDNGAIKASDKHNSAGRGRIDHDDLLIPDSD